MDRVTNADRVTPEIDSETDRVTSVVGKKALCAHLGWSRPALDRRLRRDRNFPVLHCGRAGDAWRFDLSAVVAHLESSSKRLGRPPKTADRPPGIAVGAISSELERALVIRRTIAELLVELLVELGALLERMDAVLCFEGSPTLTDARGSEDGPDN